MGSVAFGSTRYDESGLIIIVGDSVKKSSAVSSAASAVDCIGGGVLLGVWAVTAVGWL